MKYNIPNPQSTLIFTLWQPWHIFGCDVMLVYLDYPYTSANTRLFLVYLLRFEWVYCFNHNFVKKISIWTQLCTKKQTLFFQKYFMFYVAELSPIYHYVLYIIPFLADLNRVIILFVFCFIM